MDKNQLTFDDYLSLSRDKDTTKWSNNKICQVLSINGFGGYSRFNRNDLVEALNLVNLVPATRSTIDSDNGPIRSRHVSPPSLHMLKTDMEELGWQECPIGSIVTIDPAAIVVKNKTVKTNKNETLKKNKNKTVKKNKRIVTTSVPSVESLVVDASIANRDDVEMTSPVKKQKIEKKTIRVEDEMLNIANRDDVEMASPVKKQKMKKKATRVEAAVLNIANRDDVKMTSPVKEMKKTKSPVEKMSTESPVEKMKTKSPVEKVKTKSPGEKMNIKSPVEKVKTKSPVEKMKTKSPVEKMKKIVRVPAGVLKDADQFSWFEVTRQKVKGSLYTRNYFKCKNWKQGCPAKRHVHPDPIDPSTLIITYYNGEHDHPIP